MRKFLPHLEKIRKGDGKMTISIPNKFMVSLGDIEGLPNLAIVYESNEVDFLKIAKKIKKKFGGRTKILRIDREMFNAVGMPTYYWKIIEGTNNL
jgi:hypothetical protein